MYVVALEVEKSQGVVWLWLCVQLVVIKAVEEIVADPSNSTGVVWKKVDGTPVVLVKVGERTGQKALDMRGQEPGVRGFAMVPIGSEVKVDIVVEVIERFSSGDA
jgi:hypothetical protein